MKNKDLDLVELVGWSIRDTISPMAYETMMNDPELKKVNELNVNYQRLLINKWLLGKLLRFRAENEIDITNVIVFLSTDGLVTDWIKAYQMFILPFLIKYQVLGPVLVEQNNKG